MPHVVSTPPAVTPFSRSPPSTTRYSHVEPHVGLASTEATGGAFSLLEYRSRLGNEPPPHLHVGRDELLYIVEGEIEAYTGDVVTIVRTGQARSGARLVVNSPALRMLILTIPAGLDHYFSAMAEPATSMVLPEGGLNYIMADPAHAIAVGRRFGIHILTPAETSTLLPGYPGFGASAADWARFGRAR